MIVKVQAAIASTEGANQVLIYNKTRDVMWNGEDKAVTDKIKHMMDVGAILQPKAFFHAELKNTKIVIGDQAPWQSW